MNKEEIKDFLGRHNGYRKEGAGRLQSMLDKKGYDVTKKDCKDALREFRIEFRELMDMNYLREVKMAKEVSEASTMDGMTIKSRWQNAGGVWLESYKAEGNTVDDFAELKEGLLKDIIMLEKNPIPTPKFTKNPWEVLYEISLPDFHFGKDDGSTIEEQVTAYVLAIQMLYEKGKGNNITKFLLPIGNDLFNSDNLNYTTTKGTNQRDITNWQSSFRLGTLAVIESVKYLLQFAPVDILVIQGNHDYQKSFYMGEVVEAYFLMNKNVNVDNNINSPRKYYEFGNCLLGFTHGDKEKPQELPLIMAVEHPLAFSRTTYKEWHIGHLHKHMHDEYQGISVKMLPSLCGQDEWHKQMGYISNRRAQAYVWNFATGLEGFLQING